MKYMKAINQSLIVAGLLLAGSVGLSSCYQRDNNYNTNPNNYNYHNHSTDSSTSSYDEQFNGVDNSVWTFTNASDSAYASITNDTFQYVDYSTVLYNSSVVNTGINAQNNFKVTTRVKSNNIMGLIFGASATSSGYAFYIDTVGNYSLYAEGTGSTASTVIIPSTQDTAYAVKHNWNVLELDQTNGTWTGFINGTQVFSMAARTISGNGFGFKVLPLTIGYASYLDVQND
jgi:hypothetical protein